MRSCGADCPYQLCGRRTFYQLLVCDNTMETDIGAPYYSDQQLFPGFMMAEYDGTNTPPHSALCTLHSALCTLHSALCTLHPRPPSSLHVFSFARVAVAAKCACMLLRPN
jgi:hypothetical protein